MILGAAIGGAIGNIPSWAEAFEADGTGGVLNEMLKPAGGFGRFVSVIIAFSILGNAAGSMYSVSIQFAALIPYFAKVPRGIFCIILFGVVVGVAIPISTNLVDSLENFLGVIAYWGVIFIGILSTEHLYFRRGNAANYDPAIWNVGSKLPPGFAALTASILPFAMIIPCMAQTWYVGPIGKHTGDIAFEMAFCICIILYIPLRTLEKRKFGR